MQGQFVRNLVFLLFVNILVKPLYIFGIDRSVQNTVGEHDYGTYSALLNIAIVFSIVLDFGLTNYNNRLIAYKPEKLSELFGNMLVIKLIFSVLYIVSLSGVLFFLRYNNFQIAIGLNIGLAQVLLSLLLYLRSNISGLQLFSIDSVFSVLDKIIMLLFGFIVLVVLGSSFSIYQFVYYQLISLAVAVFGAFSFLFFRVGKIKFSFDMNEVIQILKQTLPFACLYLLMSVYNKMDMILLERLLHDNGKQAGIYAAGYRILDALNQFGYLFAALLLPMFTRLMSEQKSIQHLFETGFRLLSVLSISAVIILFFHKYEIIHLLYKSSNTYWANVFGVLVFVFIPISTIYLFGSLLTASGHLRLLIYISMFAIVCMLLICFNVIWSFQAWGVACALLITQALAAMFHIVLALKKLDIIIHLRLILSLAIFFICSYAMVYCIHLYSPTWLLSLVMSFFAVLFTAFLSKLVDYKQLIDLVKQRIK